MMFSAVPTLTEADCDTTSSFFFHWHAQDGKERTYIAASYVKFLESAGARVVPILHTSSPERIDTLFSRINGVLIPGGNVNLLSESLNRVLEKEKKRWRAERTS